MPTTTTARLTTSESLMLDIIRVVAAAVVAFGHLTQSHFSTGWTDRTYLARNAVSVFFVLSGFVIRYVTSRNPATFRQYMVDRASRIYSIAIPALLLTWATDSIARTVNPGFYSHWADYGHAPFAILANLLFCGQLWTHPIAPLSNTPYWSVNYEVAYYIAYGCFFYLRGVLRWGAIAALCLFFGPRIVYLSVLWILGCLAHDLYQYLCASDAASRWLNALLLIPIAAFTVVFFDSAQHPGLTQLSVFSRLPHLYSMMNSVGVRPPEFAFGFLWVIIFLRLLLLARSFSLKHNSRFVRSIRFVAEGTFPIYLIHFPLLVLIAACVPYDHGNPFQKLLIFIGIVTIGIVAGHPGNIVKLKIRSLFLNSAEEESPVLAISRRAAP